MSPDTVEHDSVGPAKRRPFRLLPPLRKPSPYDRRQMVLNPAGVVARSVLGFFALVLVLLALFSVRVVDSHERAVVFDRIDGDLYIIDEGAHFVPRLLNTVTYYDVRDETYTETAIGITDEKQETHTEVTVRYAPDPAAVQTIHQRLGPHYERKVVVPAVQGCVKDAVSFVTIDGLTGTARANVNQNIRDCLTAALKRGDLLATEITITDFDFSDAVNSALEKKAVAKQAAEEASFRQLQAEVDANTTRIKAQAEADAARLLAEATRGEGGEAYLMNLCLEAWVKGGAQVPEITNGAITPCLFVPGPSSSLIVQTAQRPAATGS